MSEQEVGKGSPAALSKSPITRAMSGNIDIKPKSLTLGAMKAESPTSPNTPKKKGSIASMPSKLDFGERSLSQLEVIQFHTLRRVVERRISAIMGEERSVELLRIPDSGNKPRFYPLVPPLDTTKAKGGIFGMDLYSAVKKTPTDFFVEPGVSVKVPFIVEQCLKYLSKEEVLKTDGIFRKPGNTRRMTELQVVFDTRPMQPVDFSQFSVHDVAGLLKRYVRELPEPVFTLRLQNFFFASSEMTNVKRRLVCLQLLLIILPKHNRDLLFALMYFLKRIANNSGTEEGNRMDPYNLAVVFAPNIAKAPIPTVKGDAPPMTLKQAQEEGAESMKLVELLIIHCEDLFSFHFKKCKDFPLNRGDTISEGKKLATLEQLKGVAKPSTAEESVPEETLSNKERFLRSSFRSKEELLAMRDLSAGFPTDMDSSPKPPLTKMSSAPNSMTLSKTDDDLPPKKDGTLKSKPRVRTLSERSERPAEAATGIGKSQLSIVEGPEQADDEHTTHSEPAEAPSHLGDDEYDHYAAMQEQSALPEEDAGSSSDEDSDTEEGEGRVDSPSVSAISSGRVFEGNVMNKALSLRIKKDAKNKRVFLFGDITVKQGLDIFKKLHKNVGPEVDVIDTLPPIDFLVSFEEMKIYDVWGKMKNPASGIEVKNRRKNLRQFKNCFVGKEALDWLCNHAIEGKTLTRLQAQVIGREMLELGLVEQAFEGTADFKDDNVFYRFASEPPLASPLTPSQ